MDIREFTQNISDYINKAIDLGKEVTGGDVALSTDIRAVGDLDKVIAVLKEQYAAGLIDDKTAWNASVLFGTVLGEMIIAEHFYEWAISADKMPIVKTHAGDQVSPITKIYKIICDKDGMEGDADGFYKTFVLLREYYREKDAEAAPKATVMPTRPEMKKSEWMPAMPEGLKDDEDSRENEEDDEEDEWDEPEEDEEDEDDDGFPEGAETYPWDRFYPDHMSDKVVDMMRKEGVRLVQGSGIKAGDLADALCEIEKTDNRLKVLKDLKADGYNVQEKDILEFFNMDGDGPVLNEMVRMYTGSFSKKVLVEFYTYGTDIKLSEMLKKVSGDLDLTESEIIDILNSVDDSDVAGIKELLSRYNPKSIKKDTVVEICDVLPSSALAAAKKYLKLLPFADRVEIEDEYF